MNFKFCFTLVIGYVLFRDFDISQPDANDRTALHWALDIKKFSKAKILLDNDAGIFMYKVHTLCLYLYDNYTIK